MTGKREKEREREREREGERMSDALSHRQKVMMRGNSWMCKFHRSKEPRRIVREACIVPSRQRPRFHAEDGSHEGVKFDLPVAHDVWVWGHPVNVPFEGWLKDACPIHLGETHLPRGSKSIGRCQRRDTIEEEGHGRHTTQRGLD